jgi:hypothetical protein
MKRQYVKSAAIISVGYDPESLTLEVRFINRDLYQYFNVQPEEYEALMNAESFGEHFNKVFKANDHKFKKIEEGLNS